MIKVKRSGLLVGFSVAAILAGALGSSVALAKGAAVAPGTEALVSVGSPVGPFAQNKQNEPAMAVDAWHSNILAAGSNDEIDLEACSAGDPTRCPFTPGVGVSGIYFSFDSGKTWTQPTYQGLSARTCVTTGTPCTPQIGPIGTLPGYYEAGLSSDGDPALAFGPRPGSNGFSWANGSRLYYANLTSNILAKRDETFRGFEGIAVSRTDDVKAAAANDATAWMAPVIASKQSATTFSDKEQIWADNASTSPYFGNVYVCDASFRSQELGLATPAPLILATSTDGGTTWANQQISPAANNSQNNPPDGCTVRTDSHGVVYVFGIGTDATTKLTGELLSRSFDGGRSFEAFRFLFPVVKPGLFDTALGRPTMDGIAGARVDLAAAPSVDIANGAPTGADATDELLINWADGAINAEKSLLRYSTDHGQTWSASVPVSGGSDRPYLTAISISPNGTDAYLTYDAYLAPYQRTTSTLRPMQAVVKHAPVTGGLPGAFTEIHRGKTGDARGSSQNNLRAEFFGDYVYAVATRSYGAVVWNDVRNGADCPAIDTFRAGIEAGTSPARPSPNTDCPLTFGNTDIYGFTTAP